MVQFLEFARSRFLFAVLDIAQQTRYVSSGSINRQNKKEPHHAGRLSCPVSPINDH
ncbi:hypothetical protein D1AOALGA4SA_1840 [Olavius algarvensis Delta 1 endosymbiont]|nr:hypothetical protein D1AOALGA4SA_1840 [Olavius algarvensis Delta 1 endosymbiont]